jgi:uncharacterized coiled-coil protein SlyX
MKVTFRTEDVREITYAANTVEVEYEPNPFDLLHESELEGRIRELESRLEAKETELISLTAANTEANRQLQQAGKRINALEYRIARGKAELSGRVVPPSWTDVSIWDKARNAD